MYLCIGNDDAEAGDGYEFLYQVIITLKNYVSRDPQGMLKIGEGQTISNLDMYILFIEQCFSINRDEYDWMDGIAVISLAIALFENMPGMIDKEFPKLLAYLASELKFKQSLQKETVTSYYESMLYQAFSMAFVYNAELVFRWMENENITLDLFQGWF